MAKRKVKAMMIVHNPSLEVLASITLHSLLNTQDNRMIVESYIEQCVSFVDVQELESALKSFYGQECFIIVKMEIK